MIEFAKKIKCQTGIDFYTVWAKHHSIGFGCYDHHGKYWEVGEDINFDKFWFREVKDKESELVVKGFRKDD